MGREIEMKIALTQEEFLSVYKAIYGEEKYSKIQFGKVQLLFKQDKNYSRYKTHKERKASSEPKIIRLRKEEIIELEKPVDFTNQNMSKVSEIFKSFRSPENKNQSFFTIKYKTRQDGIEFNREDETFVEKQEVIEEMLEIAGYECWFTKEKCAWSSHCTSSILDNTDFHLELEAVNNLLYLEVEVTESDKNPDAIKNGIIEFIKTLKINPEHKDSRSWVEILSV